MRFGRLFLGTLLVAPLSGCGGTIISLGLEMQKGQGNHSGDTMIAAFIFFALLACIAILAGLIVIGLPLALLASRAGLPWPVRDALFAALIGVAAWLPARTAADLIPLAIAYWALTSLLWIAALHFADSPRRTPAA